VSDDEVLYELRGRHAELFGRCCSQSAHIDDKVFSEVSAIDQVDHCAIGHSQLPLGSDAYSLPVVEEELVGGGHSEAGGD
jgi:enterochelin esterase-like enzyme